MGWLEEALRGARGHLEEDVRAWNADLTAVITALRHEIGTRENGRLSEARERLERLEGALRQAPEQIVEHVRQRTAEFAAANTIQLRRIGELEAAERKLASANEQLRLESSERERLERVAREVERGLREVRERFESAFDNAPIGMALIAMDDRWLQVNDALCRITGHPEQALKATTLRAMMCSKEWRGF